jgi:ribosomal protein S21
MSVNVRVEMRFHGGSRQDRDKSATNLLRQFKRACNEAGILRELNERKFFESKSRKRRRELKQAKLQNKYSQLNGLGNRHGFEE